MSNEDIVRLNNDEATDLNNLFKEGFSYSDTKETYSFALDKFSVGLDYTKAHQIRFLLYTARVHYQERRTAEGDQACEQALNLYKQIESGRVMTEIKVRHIAVILFNNLGTFEYRKGRGEMAVELTDGQKIESFERGKRYFEKSFQLFEETDSSTPHTTVLRKIQVAGIESLGQIGACLGGLVTLYAEASPDLVMSEPESMNLDLRDEARKVFRQALSRAMELPEVMIHVSINFASYEIEWSQFDLAEPILEKAFETYKNLSLEEQSKAFFVYARDFLLENLIHVYCHFGNYKKMEQIYEEAKSMLTAEQLSEFNGYLKELDIDDCLRHLGIPG